MNPVEIYKKVETCKKIAEELNLEIKMNLGFEIIWRGVSVIKTDDVLELYYFLRGYYVHAKNEEVYKQRWESIVKLFQPGGSRYNEEVFKILIDFEKM